ncbi:ThuA domain-containing protein [Tautonia plasticadhaerens]|uniref:Trehalose utilization n=1 Tax=Tautonia plasticadhaerens TaxID=2527974 RepID=A0A518HD94_9BACT|nr:ThuA domain-containing protein [Tautonia plasticadhaerens]QDV38838.1 Trehalose utilization [Tautonia plasticadhaerens]
MRIPLSPILAALIAAALPGAARGGPDDADSKKVVFVAGPRSHGYGEHEHRAGCLLLAEALEAGMPGFEAEVVSGGWPEDESVFDGADAIVIFSDGAGGHPAIPNREEVDAMMAEGVGLVCLHFAVEVPAGQPGDDFLDWLGGYFELGWSVNPHWTAEFSDLPEHPITRGVEPFALNDEWYYHMRFRPGMEGVTPILSAVPPESSLSRPDGDRSGNPEVRRAVAAGEPQHVAWAFDRPEGGRGFGFTGAHVHWNWGDDSFRTVVLNAIVWASQGEIPEGGVPSQTPSREELEANQDEPKPGA